MNNMLKKEKGELTKKSKAGIEVERATPGSSFWSTLDSFLVICLDSLFGDFRLKFLATTGFFFGRSVHLVSHWVRKRKVIATSRLKVQFVAVEILERKQN